MSRKIVEISGNVLNPLIKSSSSMKPQIIFLGPLRRFSQDRTKNGHADANAVMDLFVVNCPKITVNLLRNLVLSWKGVHDDGIPLHAPQNLLVDDKILFGLFVVIEAITKAADRSLCHIEDIDLLCQILQGRF